MEESPAFTIALIQDFLKDRLPAAPQPVRTGDERRVTPGEFKFPDGAPGTGTSGISGIRTVVLKGDPERAGLYTIMLRIPANTRIAAHDHQDDRVATVVSGTWYIGYGDRFNRAGLKALPPGSFYTEPSNRAHFAETREGPVVVQINWRGTIVDTLRRGRFRPAARPWEAVAARETGTCGYQYPQLNPLKVLGKDSEAGGFLLRK